jgi:spore maturation protein SpmA
LEKFIDIILQSGNSAVDLVFYTLLPIMVIMMAFMKLLEAKGIVYYISKLLSPILKFFGIAGIGVFAVLQLSFISFAAPLATFKIMELNEINRKNIAATLSMILTMSQANVIFPMITVGLNIKIILITSLLSGLFAASITYYIFTKNLPIISNNNNINLKNTDNKILLIYLYLRGKKQLM